MKNTWLSGEELEENDVVYLHGLCHEWALNNYKDGDDVIVISEYDEDVEAECLVHCCLFRHGKYVDVRGETDNFDEVLDDFDYGELNEFLFETKKDFRKYLKKIKVI